MPKLCKQCPNGHRAGSNSQKKCHTCGYRFYKKRHTRVNCTKKCPVCLKCVGGNNTKTCKKCGHIFKKSKTKMERDIDWYLDELYQSFML